MPTASSAEGNRRQLGADRVVKFGELGNDEGDEKDEEQADHAHQQRRIDQRGLEFLAEAERDALERKKAAEHLFEVARALAGEQGGGVDDGESALGLKCGGDRLAGAHPRGNVLQLRSEVGVFLLLGEHLERAEDGQAGADEGQKLLVEDDEGFELGLLALGRKTARLDGVDVVAGGGELGAQFFGRGGGLGLLLDVSAFVGEFDYEFCH